MFFYSWCIFYCCHRDFEQAMRKMLCKQNFDPHLREHTMFQTLSSKEHPTTPKHSNRQSQREMIIIWKRVDRHRNIHTHTHTHTHTSWKEGTDHEAEVDGGHGKDEQEHKDQCGVTVGQHCSVRAHLKKTVLSYDSWGTFRASNQKWTFWSALNFWSHKWSNILGTPLLSVIYFLEQKCSIKLWTCSLDFPLRIGAFKKKKKKRQRKIWIIWFFFFNEKQSLLHVSSTLLGFGAPWQTRACAYTHTHTHRHKPTLFASVIQKFTQGVTMNNG